MNYLLEKNTQNIIKNTSKKKRMNTLHGFFLVNRTNK
jgi:hypothetical protein